MLFIDDGGWAKVQVRRGKSGDVRWESAKLEKGQADNGWIAGRDRMYPGIYTDSSGLDTDHIRLRLRFRCP